MTVCQHIDEMGPATCEYRAAKSASVSGSTLTVTACDIDTANPKRHAFGLLNFTSSTSANVTGATVGGITGKVHGFQKWQFASVYLYTVLVSAKVPTGTAADYTITTSAGMGSVTVSCKSFRVLNLRSDTPIVPTIQYQGNGAFSFSQNVKKGGLLIGGTNVRIGSSDNMVWSGVTEAYDIDLGSGFRYSGGFLEVAADEVSRAISLASSGGGTFFHSTVIGSFR